MSFLTNKISEYRRGGIDSKAVLKAFHDAHSVRALVVHLAKRYETPLKAPDYYFPGYRLFLRLSFFRHLVLFCMKIFILTNRIFCGKDLLVDNPDAFLKL
jgi:hypothetical protein